MGLAPSHRIFFVVGPLAFLLAFSRPASANDRIWGAEFTFSLFRAGTAKRDRAFEDLDAVLKRRCPELKCRVTRTDLHRRTVTFPDGVEILFKTDPNVIEVIATPGTLDEWSAREERFQSVIFETMAEIGLRPTSLYGSGHISTDFPIAFPDGSAALANFMADYYNHPALSDGIFEKDFYNALPLYLEPEPLRTAIHDAIENAIHGPPEEARALAWKIQTLYTWRTKRGLYKGHALYFPNGDTRLEFRAFRSQKSVREFIDQATLLDRRIEFVNKLTREGKRIAWKPRKGSFTLLQSLAQFYDYLRPLGLDWDYYRSRVLPAKYRAVPAFDNAFFREYSLHPCGVLLKRVRRAVHRFLAE